MEQRAKVMGKSKSCCNLRKVKMQLENVITKLIKFMKLEQKLYHCTVTSGGVDSMEKYKYIIGQINA